MVRKEGPLELHYPQISRFDSFRIYGSYRLEAKFSYIFIVKRD
jgi:hypothetical protein